VEFPNEYFKQTFTGGLMSIRYWSILVLVAQALVSPLLAFERNAVDENKQEQQGAFVKMMRGFIKAEGLKEFIEPSYVCQSGQEVCGRVSGNLEEVLDNRPDFVPDTYNFQRAHPGSTCSYRGKSGSSHYSLHVVCYGPDVAGVHIDVRLPEGLWGNFEHNVRDVAENYFKVYALRIKDSHTNEMKLARNFQGWWRSYQTAYPEFAAREIPMEAEELLNGPKQTVQVLRSTGAAGGFR
jgi:hypothetical protein